VARAALDDVHSVLDDDSKVRRWKSESLSLILILDGRGGTSNLFMIYIFRSTDLTSHIG
jgi:hypothetical protein